VRENFLELADRLERERRAGETLLLHLSAERSDFVRFNRSRVRQAGRVEQRRLAVRLVHARRQAETTLTLAGSGDDLGPVRAALGRLRAALAQVPEDPWLAIAEEPTSTVTERRGGIPSAETVMRHIAGAAEGHDLVGFYAGGTIFRGFANSFGQRNWHEIDCFNFDWSLHREPDRAVKAQYAGCDWDAAAFDAKFEAAAARAALIELPPRTIATGEHRAYLAPPALDELVGLLHWGGFSARARATRQSPLLRMQHGATLSPRITLTENTRDGLAPCFQKEGFVKPPAVPLIVEGRLGDALVSPRSAREYGLATNAAGARESPESLEMAPGEIDSGEILAALDTGLYVGNLWYLNFSDRPAGRVTGMTRFATFWAENGRLVAPVAAMRFDDTIYRMLGESLIGLTREREFLLDPSTYEERSTASARLPGALLRSLRFTL
jgi:predicted Zn-dependent protease